MREPITKYYVILSINSQTHPYADELATLLTQKVYSKYFREDGKPRETFIGAGEKQSAKPHKSEWSLYPWLKKLNVGSPY